MNVGTSLRRVLRGARDAVRRPAAVEARLAPLLTVVVPFYDVEEYLAEAVGSLREQTHTNLEVLLVDDGSRDGSLALARALTADDSRFTVLEVPHGGQGAARNHALARARGEYVTFMDADDVVPPDAYAAMVGSLEASGSDMVLGNVERFDSERAWIPGWARVVHGADLQGMTLADLPDAMRDILACNRVYRRTFWDTRVRAFPEGMVFEDHVPMLRALLGGSRFDVLAQVTYRWRRREDRGSSSQPKDELANLADRVRAKDEAWALLEAEGTESERGLWLARVLDLDLSPYLGHGGTAEPAYQDLLATTAARFLALAEASESFRRVWSERVRGHRRLALWYAAHRDWAALASLTEDLEARRPPLLVHSGEAPAGSSFVVADPGRTVVAPPLPDWLARMRPLGATSLVLTRLAWDDEALVVRGTLRVPGAALGPETVSVTLVLGDDVAAHVTGTTLAAAPRRVDAPVTGSELDVCVRVPRAVLARALPAAGDVRVRATARLVPGVEVDVRLVPGTGTRAPRPVPDAVGGTRVLPVAAEDDGLVLRAGPAPVVVERIDVVDDVVRLTFASSCELDDVRFGPSVPLTLVDGRYAARLDALAALDADTPLEVRAGGRDVRPLVGALAGRDLPRGLACAARGTLHAIPGARLVLHTVVVDDDGIRLELTEAGRADVPADARWTAVLRDGDEELPVPAVQDGTGVVRLGVPTAAAVDGVVPSVASVGLRLRTTEGDGVSLRIDGRVLDAQPFRATSGKHDVRVLVRSDEIWLRVEHVVRPR
ncbi:glycosyltransferase family 2 protein [Sanguibacter massiliensis]|uniref:glycosyltransferase family 2 protein n=1 Tax=Sanguibacter massiliensis TaxID=1973217 RepID=UPI000C857061|nr:glycosyltransferase family 2 protein [Sanguibacter massiliensis]